MGIGEANTLLGQFIYVRSLYVLAMSITPYINASIIMQLLTAVVPTFEQWAKDNQEGRDKIQKVTRYGTVVLALIQAFAMSYALKVNNALIVDSWAMVVMVSVCWIWDLLM